MAHTQHMTHQKPTAAGWYWYQLSDNWPVQPVLVFDSGPDGLMYTLDAISPDETDEERDGFFLDETSPDALWSEECIFPPIQS